MEEKQKNKVGYYSIIPSKILLKLDFGQNPLPIEQFEKIYNDNLGILVTAGLLV